MKIENIQSNIRVFENDPHIDTHTLVISYWQFGTSILGEIKVCYHKFFWTNAFIIYFY